MPVDEETASEPFEIRLLSDELLEEAAPATAETEVSSSVALTRARR
jgi:hypothetical protein